MAIESITTNVSQRHNMKSFMANRKNISYGYINLEKSKDSEYGLSKKDKILAGVGSSLGVAVPVLAFMKHQKVNNMFKLEYNAYKMIGMAAAANIGGILLSSIGESKKDQKKKWKEGAFQMSLTTLPLLLVDGSIKLVEKCKSAKINNNFVKIIASAFGVAIGSNTAIAISNKLRNDKEAKKPKRELKLIDMIANIDDVVAIMVLAKIPFAKKIKIERALPFIYAFCGYRSGTGDKKTSH